MVPTQPGALDPAIAVESFTLCNPDAPVPVDTVPVSLVSIAELKHVDLATGADAAASTTDKQAPMASSGSGSEDDKQQQQQQQPAVSGVPPNNPLAVRPGRCGTASAWQGMFHVKLCVDEVQSFGPDIAQLAGQVENVGEGSICDLRLANGFAPDAVLTSWPEGTHQGRSALAQPLAPGDKLNVGVTASHTRGLAAARQGVLPFPSLSLVTMRPCNQPANAAPLLLELVEEGPLPTPSVDLLAARTDDGDGVFDIPRRGLAMKGGAKPTTMETINWDLCGYYTGKDGQSELALCWKDARTWKDREAGRVVQTNLVLVNTGKFGVCNVTIEIENIDQELGDHYPQDWIDEVRACL